MTIETTRSADSVLCHIIRSTCLPRETQFVTGDDLALQVGHIVRAAGDEIPRHHHLHVRRQVEGAPEVLVVRSGRCEVDIYDEARRLVATHDLRTGDIILLLGGGHGFRMTEDTVLLEVKPGPYQGPQERIRF